MSKLMTDSEALMYFLFDGSDASDTPISRMITDLKEATLACTEIRVTIEYVDPDRMRNMLDRVNTILVESWQNILALQSDFKDLIDTHFKEGGVTQ